MNVLLWLSIVSTSLDPHATASQVYIGLSGILSSGLLIGFCLLYWIWPRASESSAPTEIESSTPTTVESSAPTAIEDKEEAKNWSKHDSYAKGRCC